MKALNQQTQQFTDCITYTQYVAELELNKIDLLSSSVIKDVAERHSANHVSPAMVHYALMEAGAELFPTSNYSAYVQYAYGKAPFPIDTKFSLCDDAYCAVSRIIYGLLHKNPAYRSEQKAWVKQKKMQRRQVKSISQAKSGKPCEVKHLVSSLLAATSLNCVADKSFGVLDEVFKGTTALLLQRGLTQNLN